MPIIVDNQQRIIRVKSEDEKTVATISFRARKAIVEKLEAMAKKSRTSVGTQARVAMEDYFELLR